VTDANDQDLQALWQSQMLDQTAISLDDLRVRARRCERIVTRRNLREYVGAVMAVVGFCWILWVGPSVVIRAGAAMFIAGTLFVVYRLHVRGSATTLPADLAFRSAVEFYRLQLEQQRDLLFGVGRWYVLPLIPGLIAVQIGRGLEQPDRWSQWMFNIGITIACAVGIHFVNRRAAARIQRRIDRLPEQS
jgi:hypothetical protein